MDQAISILTHSSVQMKKKRKKQTENYITWKFECARKAFINITLDEWNGAIRKRREHTHTGKSKIFRNAR